MNNDNNKKDLFKVNIEDDGFLNPEELDKASKKAAQRATFKKFVVTSTDEVSTTPTIGIAK